MEQDTTMEPIIITSSSNKKRDSRFKRFLNDHCYIVDFLSASITILLCLVVLLPRVHESFLPDDDHQDHNHELEPANNNNININITTLADVVPVPSEPHKHVHNHRFPIGEVLICIGFFVFYCIGIGLARPQVTMVDQHQLFTSQRRKQSVCCSSTRCPSSVPPQNVSASTCQEVNHQPAGGESGASRPSRPSTNVEQSLLSSDEQQADNNDEDCVMLLNPHHQHHTHTKHHEHQHGNINVNNQQDANVKVPTTKRRVNYGATGQSSDIRAMLAMVDDQERASPTTIVVDEIRIVSESSEWDSDPEQHWPHSLRLLLFSLVLALALFFLDMNVLGMIRAIKVFRAASTGALLYVAFFIMIPRKSVSCNSCTEEET